jgi:hypothetical protein
MRGCYSSFRVGCLHALVLICTVVARARYLACVLSFGMAVGAEVDILVCCLNRYRNQGKLDKAIELYEKALSIKIKVLGEEHPDVATSYNNLGAV